MKAHLRWKYVAVVCLGRGQRHPVWRDVIGKQRIGERYSCLGFMTVRRALRARQKFEDCAIGSYEWDSTLGFWVSIGDESVIDSNGKTLAFCPSLICGAVDVLDPGGDDSWVRKTARSSVPASESEGL